MEHSLDSLVLEDGGGEPAVVMAVEASELSRFCVQPLQRWETGSG